MPKMKTYFASNDNLLLPKTIGNIIELWEVFYRIIV
jgi:hypothetical protein